MFGAWPGQHLLRLLGSGGTRNVATNIGGLVALTHNTLEGLPTLADLRGSALVGKRSIGTGGKLTNSLLNKGALGVASAEERQVDNQEHPATLGEGDSRQDKAEKQCNFESGDNTHASIVVLLDEASNGLGEGGLLGGGLGGGGRRS